MEHTNIIDSAGITGDNVTSLTYLGFVNLKAKLGQDILDSLTPEKCHLLHMAYGVIGEAGEALDADGKEHLLEECGDMEFYLQGMTLNGSQIGVTNYTGTLKVYHETIISSLQEKLVVETAKLADALKKPLLYNKEFDYLKINDHWFTVHYFLESIYALLGTTRQAVIAANVDKLNKRYVKGYSDTEAQQRNDKPLGE